jgi:hypothetical protein
MTSILGARWIRRWDLDERYSWKDARSGNAWQEKRTGQIVYTQDENPPGEALPAAKHRLRPAIPALALVLMMVVDDDRSA